MKRISSLLVLAGSFVASIAPAVDFNDIQFWVGSGANQAALVIDWNDGKSAESLVWGYRWNGSATGLDMFTAIVNADPRLFGEIDVAGPFGVPIYGMGYDLNGNNVFGVSPSLSFDAGGMGVSSGDESRGPTDAGDHWLEGNFTTSFWGYFVKASSGDAWGFADSGASGRDLTDGAWDGYSFAPGFVGGPPSEPSIAAVPEPATWAIMISGAFAFVCTRRNKR